MRLSLLAAGMALLLLVPVVLIGAVAGALTTSIPIKNTNPSDATAPSAHALADIPPDYLAWYLHWGRECPGLAWMVVAAIGKLESDHGRAKLPGVNTGTNAHGAAGPMQIGTGGHAGDTWAAYGSDGDLPPDGTADVYHPPDAIRTAYRYLCAHGASDPSGLRPAVLAYNPSPAYADSVLDLADRYRTPAITADANALLNDPRVQLSANARADLEAGIIDPRVVGVLSALAQRYPIAVSVLKTGHSPYVAGTSRYSNHYFGRAADIHQINGQPVSQANPAARDAVAWLASLTDPLRPDEVGSPFVEFDPIPGWFSDQAHHRHIHVGHGP